MQLIADDEQYTSRERVAQICAALALRGWAQPHLFHVLYVKVDEDMQRKYWANFKSYVIARLTDAP